MNADPRGERSSATSWGLVALVWSLVGMPLAWGVYQTLQKALLLFR